MRRHAILDLVLVINDKRKVCINSTCVGYYIACLAKCNEGSVDGASLKGEDVKGPSCTEQVNKQACSSGFDKGVDEGAGSPPAAAVAAKPAAPPPAAETSGVGCESKCDESPGAATDAHCK